MSDAGTGDGRVAPAFDVVAVPTPGLGNHAYLVASGGEAVVVDPPRDAWRIAAVAEEQGWGIVASLETHVHNDYLSGARELRRSLGAGVVAPARGRYRYATRAADEGARLPLGSIELVARATPGHTPEHIGWEARDRSGRPLALFSGGSLLVAGVGRTDLLGPSHADRLTDAQFATMRRLAELPDDVVVYPTHGIGSFCVAGASGGSASATIGSLRLWNRAFAATDRAAFEAELAGARTRFPSYYARMAPLNRRGPRLLGGPPTLPELSPVGLAAARDGGAWVVDVRGRRDFAAGHVPGALNVELDESLAAYVGWLVPFDAPIALVADDRSEATSATTELLRIGYDHVGGWLAGGMAAWAAAGLPTARFETVTWRTLRDQAAGAAPGPARILDVRQPSEWGDGTIPGSRLVFVADLPGVLASLDRSVTWTVACRSGARAAIAASLLDAAGVPVRAVAVGGIPSLPASELVAA